MTDKHRCHQGATLQRITGDVESLRAEVREMRTDLVAHREATAREMIGWSQSVAALLEDRIGEVMEKLDSMSAQIRKLFAEVSE